MKKTIAALAIAVLATGTAGAQTRRSTVSGVVADADTREGMIGVVVQFIPRSDSTKTTAILTGAGGTFSTGLGREGHRVKVSSLGYTPLERTIEVSEARHSLDTIYLRQGIEIEAVVATGVGMRTSVRGDTLIYNADAYKVAADANVSGLLEKMPGIKVEGGTVEAQGEQVRKVLIDNREFFGEDVAAAISSLPAEAVKSIEVFDKLSDNAEFTGIDDGEGYKAINITTRETMRQGIMGQVSTLYGAEPPENGSDTWKHYGLAGGNVNIFQGDAKVTVGGTLNNLNERHFTSDDILGAGDNDGVATVGRFQANYIDTWGKKDQWKFDASYSYDMTDTDNLSVIDREYFDHADYSNLHSVTNSDRFRQNHSLNARIDFKPNQYHELRIRPTLRYQGERSSRDGVENWFPVDGGEADVLNSWSTGRETGWMAGLNANYRVRLGKPGRTLSIFLNGSYDPDDEVEEEYTERLAGSTIRKRIPSFDYNYGLMAGVTYTEPVSTNSLVNLDYSVRYNYEDIDSKAYEWNQATGQYLTDYSTGYSGQYNSGYTTHRVGPGYRMQKGRNMLAVGAAYQRSTLNSTRVLPVENSLTQSFDNITYSVLLNTQFESGTSIRMMLNSMTRNPSVSDLQDVVTNNGQNFSKGNPSLKPSYNNMGFFRLQVPSASKGTSFGFNVGGRYVLSSIASRTISNSSGYPILNSAGEQLVNAAGEPLALDAVGRYSEPVNMDGQWDARVGVDYGFPVRFLRSNLNISANASVGESPSQMGRWNGGAVDDVTWTEAYTRTISAGGGITLGSNISERVDFRLSYNPSYNKVSNTFSDRSTTNYLRQIVRGNAKFVLPAYFTLSGNFTFFDDRSINGGNVDRQYFIANAAVGKKIFRSRQGEISLFVNDIMNQNVDYRINSTAEYFQRAVNSAIGRYVGVKFTWNIRKFGKNGSTNMDLYDTGRGGEYFHGGRGGDGPGFMGPGPGGGGRYGG